MLFNSPSYILFFPIITSLYFIMPLKFRKIWLLLVSYYFYMSWNPYFAIVLLISTFSTWICGISIEQSREIVKRDNTKRDFSKIIIGACVIFNIGMLFMFKYSNFVIENLNAFLTLLKLNINVNKFDLLLPVGISFYTFQVIGYIIDVYRSKTKAERNLIHYGLFVSFFPQIVAGPIGRYSNLMLRLKQIGYVRESYNKIRDNIQAGLPILLWGYFQKLVIADRASIFVDSVYNNYTSYHALDIVLASVLYAIQIYCDFDGYTNIARGCSKILGIELTKNFQQPYLSTSIKDFWRRWHISLTSWFTDYLYISLGGNRKGEIRRYINILIVFLISGMWHGASWHYVVWGGLHGIYLIVYNLKVKFSLKSEKTAVLLSTKIRKIIITFFLVDFAWLFFRADGIENAFDIIKYTLVNNIWIPSLPNQVFNYADISILLISILILLIVDICHEKRICFSAKLAEQEIWFKIIAYDIVIFFILVVGIYGAGYDVTKFIYSQF